MSKKLELIKEQIELFFDKENNVVFMPQELNRIVDTNRMEWGLPNSLTYRKFVEYLITESRLNLIELNFLYQKTSRYYWGEENYNILLKAAASVKENSYFSHYSAMYLHDLLEICPQEIFIGFEQSPKPRGNKVLSQDGIHQAFRNKGRITNNCASYKNFKIYLVNGKFTNRLGISYYKDYRVTDIERTLIDATVRPFYSGGVSEVLAAFKKAKGKIDVEKLNSYLLKMDYVYPYHQAIGFYLEQAGYDDLFLTKMEERPIEYDFYLSHKMQQIEYSDRWKIFFPRNLI